MAMTRCLREANDVERTLKDLNLWYRGIGSKIGAEEGKTLPQFVRIGHKLTSRDINTRESKRGKLFRAVDRYCRCKLRKRK